MFPFTARCSDGKLTVKASACCHHHDEADTSLLPGHRTQVCLSCCHANSMSVHICCCTHFGIQHITAIAFTTAYSTLLVEYCKLLKGRLWCVGLSKAEIQAAVLETECRLAEKHARLEGAVVQVCPDPAFQGLCYKSCLPPDHDVMGVSLLAGIWSKSGSALSVDT